MKTILVIALALAPIACGGGGSPISSTSMTMTPVQPVHAATGFTNASINGTYAFGITGVSSNAAEAGTGVIAVDGNGNVVAGDETVNIGGISCHFSFSGTYSINSNGTGTSNLTSTADPASVARGCIGGSGAGSIAIGNAGNALVFAGQNASSVTVATAVKQ